MARDITSKYQEEILLNIIKNGGSCEGICNPSICLLIDHNYCKCYYSGQKRKDMAIDLILQHFGNEKLFEELL